MKEQHSQQAPRNDQELSVVILTPEEDWSTEFPKTTKVADVIKAVITKFNFAHDGKYELRLKSNPSEILQPERTLVSYGIKDGDQIIFTDLGRGATL